MLTYMLVYVSIDTFAPLSKSGFPFTLCACGIGTGAILGECWGGFGYVQNTSAAVVATGKATAVPLLYRFFGGAACGVGTRNGLRIILLCEP